MTTASERARYAALVRHSRGTGPETTAAARRGLLAKFERQVDPTGALAPHERAIRAHRALKAHLIAIRIRK